jgi:hypothetical protein
MEMVKEYMLEGLISLYNAILLMNTLCLLNLARGVATSVEGPWEQVQTPQIM